MKLAGSKETTEPASSQQPVTQPTQPAPKNDKPFDDEPFDAGVEADEEVDPKKFIEQLTGKLGQSLRKYTDEQGSPDFELEKFAVNSILSATHTSQMDAEDQKDIIKKVKTSGKNDENTSPEPSDNEETIDTEEPETDELNNDESSETQGLEEDKNAFSIKPKKLSIFAPEGSDEYDIRNKISESLHSIVSEKINNTQEDEEVQPIIKPSRRNKPFLPLSGIK